MGSRPRHVRAAELHHGSGIGPWNQCVHGGVRELLTERWPNLTPLLNTLNGVIGLGYKAPYPSKITVRDSPFTQPTVRLQRRRPALSAGRRSWILLARPQHLLDILRKSSGRERFGSRALAPAPQHQGAADGNQTKRRGLRNDDRLADVKVLARDDAEVIQS